MHKSLTVLLLLLPFSSASCPKQCEEGFELNDHGNCVEIPSGDDDVDDDDESDDDDQADDDTITDDDDAGPPCSDSLMGTGFEVGDTAYDFARINQHGHMVHLWDYCDRAVLVVLTHTIDNSVGYWIGDLNGWWDEWGDERLMILFVLSDDEMTTTEDLADFAETYDVEYQVLGDEDLELFYQYGGASWIPWYVMLRENAEISFVGSDGFGEIVVGDALPW